MTCFNNSRDHCTAIIWHSARTDAAELRDQHCYLSGSLSGSLLNRNLVYTDTVAVCNYALSVYKTVLADSLFQLYSYTSYIHLSHHSYS